MKGLSELIDNYSIELQSNDLVLLASDGIFDNIFKDNVADIINNV